MKNGKKPTYEQRKVIHQSGLDPHDWLVVKNTPTEMVLIHRSDKTTRILSKGGMV